MPATSKQESAQIATSLDPANSELDDILRQLQNGKNRCIVRRDGRAEAVVLGIKDYLDLVAPAPSYLKAMWEQAEEAGLDKMTMDEIDAVIAEARREQEDQQPHSARIQ